MEIIVLVKQMPDTYGDRKLDAATGLLNRPVGYRVIDQINERALEPVLSFIEKRPVRFRTRFEGC
ncbi:hypothetical protein [Cryobacterium sp. Y50]|uniref:hypothetical protein n=2 Tax=unclassified Cryobacterium TaxID=2649013 RepID=UPI000CE47580|nr:hypothetical protein [Cryobacterium sp. Y50]